MGFIASIIIFAGTIYAIYICINVIFLEPSRTAKRNERARLILNNFNSIQNSIVGMKYEDIIQSLGEKEDVKTFTAESMEIRYFSGNGVPLIIKFKQENDNWICSDFTKSA